VKDDPITQQLQTN